MQLKLLKICFIFLLCNSPAYADYDVNDLKKLFTDKRQRAQIDAARSGNHSINSVQQSKKLSVLGYMKRSGGESVVWVNNKNTLENSKIDDARVYQNKIGKDKRIPISVGGKVKRLKPGQTWHKLSDKVVDVQ